MMKKTKIMILLKFLRRKKRIWSVCFWDEKMGLTQYLILIVYDVENYL
jgi:hypothetical protein